tara:strand:+ start:912 stop:1160 length:249 start_codon:yes stop_codon:yes gene_type:complete
MWVPFIYEEIHSENGNQLVAQLVNRVLTLPLGTSDDDLTKFLSKGMQVISRAGHPEVFDTDVREQVIGTVENMAGKKLSIYF